MKIKKKKCPLAFKKKKKKEKKNTTTQNLWDPAKAVLREKFIAIQS